MAHTLGYKVFCVSIKTTVNSTGHARWSDPIPRVLRRLESVGGDIDRLANGEAARLREHVNRAIIVAKAGKHAQKRHNPRSNWRWGGSGASRGEFLHRGSDDQRALELSYQLYKREEIVDAYLKFLEACTQDLVERRWLQIGRLAKELLKSEIIRGDIRAVIAPELQLNTC
jgi:hypothetical protein